MLLMGLSEGKIQAVDTLSQGRLTTIIKFYVKIGSRVLVVIPKGKPFETKF